MTTEEKNRFSEGGDAFREWFGASVLGPVPQSPYVEGSAEDEEWQTGFDNAEDYQHRGQYLDVD